jgi:hypothetical protein
MVATSPIITGTKLSWINAALVLTGEQPLAGGLGDTRYGASVAAQLFDLIYENELQSNRWRFACTKAALAQVNTVPPNEWQYCYQLPTDMLLPIGLWGVNPDKSYEIYANHLYTNLTSNPGPQTGGPVSPVLTFDYLFKPDPSTVPSYFGLLMTYALAKDMLKPITESDSAASAMQTKYNMQRNRAMFADASGRPNRAMQSNPFVGSR